MIGKSETTALLNGAGLRFELPGGGVHAEGHHAGCSWAYQRRADGWYWHISGWGNSAGSDTGDRVALDETDARSLIELKAKSWREQLREFLK